jgi:ribosomal protein L11 methyltransferase
VARDTARMDDPAAWQLVLVVASERAEVAAFELMVAGASAVAELPSDPTLTAAGEVALGAGFASIAGLQAAHSRFGGHLVEVGTAWRDTWLAYLQPVRVHARLAVTPINHADDPSLRRLHAAGTQVVVIDAGRAFGAGDHPTTQLALAQLCDRLRPHASVLDIGCGTGILAIAALCLGARRAVGVDLDPVAIARADANAQHNGVADAASFGLQWPDAAEQFDMVIANLGGLEPVHRLASQIMARLVAGGSLIVGGVRSETVAALTLDDCLELVERRDRGGWASLVFTEANGRQDRSRDGEQAIVAELEPHREG